VGYDSEKLIQSVQGLVGIGEASGARALSSPQRPTLSELSAVVNIGAHSVAVAARLSSYLAENQIVSAQVGDDERGTPFSRLQVCLRKW